MNFMKTLFLNPNSNDEITNVMRRQISAQVLPSAKYDIQNIKDAPNIICSAQDDAIAQELLSRNFRDITSGFTRLVLMSSIDTGYQLACSINSIEVHGFTRSILARYKHLGKGLRAITFDPSMTFLYREIFESHPYLGVVQSINVLPLAPSAVANDKHHVLNTLNDLCWKLSQTSNTPIFIVGAVGLQFGEELRREGLNLVIDPISDLIDHLRYVE